MFITGATDYMGSSVAGAFRRAGHPVYNLVRGDDQARQVARSEILPVIGDLRDPASYRSIAEECDVLIHCAADYQHDWAKSDQQTMAALLAASERGQPPKTVVFTSGSWVYGDTGAKPVDESAPPKSAPVGGHRSAVEQMVPSAPNALGLVIRPANVYGRRGGMTGGWFASAYHGEAPVLPGDGLNTGRWCTWTIWPRGTVSQQRADAEARSSTLPMPHDRL